MQGAMQDKARLVHIDCAYAEGRLARDSWLAIRSRLTTQLNLESRREEARPGNKAQEFRKNLSKLFRKTNQSQTAQ
jgi:hypothetical protein